MADFLNRKNLFFISVLLIFTFISYGSVVAFDFVWDDITLFLENPYLKLPFSRIFDAFIPGKIIVCVYTPVIFVLKFIFFKFFGNSPVPYHLFNFIFYLLTIVLLYRFFLLTLKKQEIAFLSALLFAVHPIHSEIVSWVSCDGYILSMFFLMVSFNLFLDLLFNTSNFSEKIFTIVFLVLSYIVSFLSQPMSVVFPALILVYTFIFYRRKMFFSLKLSLPLFVLSGLCIYLSMIGVDSSRYNPQNQLPLQHKLVVISQYLVKSIFPFEVMPMYPLPSEYSFSVFQVFFYLLILALSIFLFIKINNRIYRFFILWFAVSISPYSHLFNSSSILMSDRYLYLPSVASSMFLACTLYYISDYLRKIDYIKNRLIACHVVTVVVFILYISASFVYSSAWKDSFSLWSYAYSKNKTNSTVIFNLALAFQERNDDKEALAFYDLYLQKITRDPAAYMERARVLQRLGRYDESLDSCRNGLKSFAESIDSRRQLNCSVCQDLIRWYFLHRDYQKAWESSVIMAELVRMTSEDDSVKASVFCMTGIISYYYGKIDDLVNYYSEGVFLLENRYPQLLVKALRYNRDGCYEDAIEYYQKFIKLSGDPTPDVRKLLHAANLKLYYSGAGKDKAEFFLRRGIIQKDEACYLLENHKYREAESLMKEILSNDPYFWGVKEMLDKLRKEHGNVSG